MQSSDKTARQLYQEVKANPTRKRFGFGRTPALINIDLQKAYTCVGEFSTAYQTDPRQLEHVNTLAAEFRSRGFPVVWTYVAYMESGEDCGIWGTRTNTPDSLQNIKVGSRRAEFDDSLEIDKVRDVVINKRMASAFFETNLGSIFTFHGVDTVVVTGGSTSGCVRATVLDSLQRSFRTIVPEECVADKHESPHFANLYDMALKYADVLSIEETLAQLRQVEPRTAPARGGSAVKRDPGFYDYLPYDQRPVITWPNGARVAFWVAPNIEFYELDPPRNPARAPWPRPAPDVLNYSYRDYGNRVGFWRMLEAMKRCGMRGSVSLNVAMCDHHPEVIAACAENGWEFYSHGTYNTRYLMGMTEAQERAVIQDSIDTIRKHTGQKLDGWLAPALTYTERTMDLVAEMGLTYVCDLFHDDQPGPVKVRQGRLTSIPYSLEMNDTIVYNVNLVSPRRYADILKRQFDRLYAEGERSGTVMCIPLHPYLIGQPYRLAAFEEALAYITGHDKVWLATGREIAHHFAEHHHAEFQAAAQPVGDAP